MTMQLLDARFDQPLGLAQHVAGGARGELARAGSG